MKPGTGSRKNSTSTTKPKLPPRGKTTIAKRSYTEEEIERGLTELALCGGDRDQAHRRLRARGHKIPPTTLQSWARQTHPERYHRIRADQAPKIAERIANEAEDFALELLHSGRATLQTYNQQIGTPEADKTASALRNIGTTEALQIDRVASPLRGRPTQIVEHRDFHDLVKKLSKAHVVEGTAEEIEQPTLETSTAG